MYYVEEWINGKLCWKAHPNAKWTAFAIGDYKEKVLKLEKEILKLKEQLQAPKQ